MTNPTKGRILRMVHEARKRALQNHKPRTMRQADELVFALGFTGFVEDYEVTDDHVYTLDDGSSLIVPTDRTDVAFVITGEEQCITTAKYLELRMGDR